MPETQHAHIRSFVLRQGRVSNAQGRAVETLLPIYGIPFSNQLIDYIDVFKRNAPVILEIGFGMGETTATIAATNPQNDYLAIEVHTPGVGNLLKEMEARRISNLRIIQHDAIEVLRDMIAPASLVGVHIFFPDPWPKKRHHKRRLIQTPLVKTLCEKLRPGAYLHIATDWQEYAEHILATLSAEPSLSNNAAGYAARPAYRPLTKFEQRGLKLGHGVWDIIFMRK
ncbi:MAG: tRNA (guanosine(46)-N7)-methyltransferase TrmB [Burkholderiales bacterium]